MLIMFFFLAFHFENSRHFDIHVLYYVCSLLSVRMCVWDMHDMINVT